MRVTSQGPMGGLAVFIKSALTIARAKITEYDAGMIETRPLSELALKLVDIQNAYDRLLAPKKTPGQAIAAIGKVNPADLFTQPVKSGDDAAAALSGIWLLHDALHESHEISQSLLGGTGSFWHAIMHRREGDFWNSKYWLDRCDGHPVQKQIGSEAAQAVGNLAEDNRVAHVLREGWDPYAFVDLVSSVHDKPGDPVYGAAVTLQRLEWALLFNHCVMHALQLDHSDLDAWDKRINTQEGQ